MSSYTIPTTSTNPSVPVHLQANDASTSLSSEELQSFPAFETWLSNLQRSLGLQHTNAAHPFHSSPYQLRQKIQSVDWFGRGDKKRLGFIKLSADASNDRGESLPGSVFLRGGSVAMLLVLQPDDTEEGEERYAIMTVQPRIPVGSLAFAELPAGMIDDEAGAFAGAAAREIKEETRLEVKANELLDMTQLALDNATIPSHTPREAQDEAGSLAEAVFPSPGGCDESVPIFFWQKRVPRAQLSEWQGKLTGLREEREKITLMLCPLADLWKVGARDGKCLAALALYNGLRREGKL